MSLCSKVVTRISSSRVIQRSSSYYVLKSSYYTVFNKKTRCVLQSTANISNQRCIFRSVQTVKDTKPKARSMGGLSPLDPSSFSRPELSVVKHVSLSLNVDFDKKVLSGIATLNIDALQEINEVILDVSKLSIESIEDGNGKKLDFTLGDDIPTFGSKLTIKLPETALSGAKLKLIIKYSTDPKASALQWLEPDQTSGKKHPYLFSQCQPIHARSILPCQDTPAVKFTYDAEVTAPPQFTILMSALRGEVNGSVTSFNQPVPLPAYLVAIAVGSLEHRTLGPRSLVWAEKQEIERSAWEFAETEKYLKAAESLCGPYVWTQYDLLVLPPSFPYGGMENPCLTFVTPTLLAGDRSLADVIVHEIMHSWTGNLVTNRNFEHFWLNEGFTVFLERKVGASLIEDKEAARKIRDFNSILGLQELNETIQITLGVGNPLTSLVVDLKGPVNPDDAYSRVPYEKGSLFLRYIEDLVGGSDVFDEFLRSYLNHFARKSLDTDQFKSYLLEYFKDNDQLKSVDWDAWLNQPGMPPVIPQYDTAMTKSVTALVQQVSSHGKISSDDVSSFSPQQMINFLQSLLDEQPLPVPELRDMADKYGLVRTQNAEIKYRWLRLSIKSKDMDRLDEVFQFVNTQGRMKYVRPVYRDLYAWEAVRERAVQNFLTNEKYMMHVSAYTLRKDLHLNE